MEIQRVLFVCTANVARSPAAELIAKTVNQNLDLSFASAGLEHASYMGMFPYMVNALRNMGYNPGMHPHMPRIITPDIIGQTDLVFCFENWQKDRLINLNAVKKSRIFTLPEFCGETGRQIIDPDDVIRHAKKAPAVLAGISPLWVRTRLGFDLREDPSRIQKVYSDTARQVEYYVKDMLPRLG